MRIVRVLSSDWTMASDSIDCHPGAVHGTIDCPRGRGRECVAANRNPRDAVDLCKGIRRSDIKHRTLNSADVVKSQIVCM